MEDINQHLSKIKEAVSLLAKQLNTLNYTWILGGSAGLMVQGVDVIPHDIDIFVEDNKIENLYQEYSKYIKDHIHSYIWNNEPSRKFKLEINDIEIEIINLPKSRTTIQKIEFNQQLIPVNSLENELEFYKSRPNKEVTVKLIEEKISQNNLSIS